MQFRNITLLALCLALGAAILHGACTSEEQGTLGDLLGALSHKYLIQDGTDCYVEISGSQISTVNSMGEKTCVRTDEGGEIDAFFEEMKNLKIDGTLKEDRITGTMLYTSVFEQGWGCRNRTTWDVTAELDLRKTKGAQLDGRFASLAGDWEGELEFHFVEKLEYTDVEPGGCDEYKAEDPDWAEVEDSTEIYEITAQIGGSEALIRYRKQQDGGSFETIDVYDFGDYLVISGEQVEID